MERTCKKLSQSCCSNACAAMYAHAVVLCRTTAAQYDRTKPTLTQTTELLQLHTVPQKCHIHEMCQHTNPPVTRSSHLMYRSSELRPREMLLMFQGCDW